MIEKKIPSGFNFVGANFLGSTGLECHYSISYFYEKS